MSTGTGAGAAYDAGVRTDAAPPPDNDEQSYERLRESALRRIEKARAALADAEAYLARLDAEEESRT